jgi:hypothetical protein
MFRPILLSFSGLDNAKSTCTEPGKQPNLHNRHAGWDGFRYLINQRLTLNVFLNTKKILKQKSRSSSIQHSGQVGTHHHNIQTHSRYATVLYWLNKQLKVRLINGIITGMCLLGAYNTGDTEPEEGRVDWLYCAVSLNRLIMIRLEDNC